MFTTLPTKLDHPALLSFTKGKSWSSPFPLKDCDGAFAECQIFPRQPLLLTGTRLTP